MRFQYKELGTASLMKEYPQCGSTEFESVKELQQFIEDIPAIHLQVTQLRTYHGVCCQCKAPVRSSHPLQVSEAAGSARCHLGTLALGLAAQLNKGYGITYRKCSAILQTLHRVVDRLKGSYPSLKKQLQGSGVLHSDETSWWVGWPKWWL